MDSIICKISYWVLVKKEFSNCSLNDMVRDWVTCVKDLNIVHHMPSLCWNPLEVGLYKVNFDGASCGNLGPSTFGCVLRDANGHGCQWWSAWCDGCYPRENHGVVGMLKLARDKGAMGCFIEGDSYSVIS